MPDAALLVLRPPELAEQVGEPDALHYRPAVRADRNKPPRLAENSGASPPGGRPSTISTSVAPSAESVARRRSIS